MVFPIFGKKPGSFLRLQGAFRGYGTGLMSTQQVFYTTAPESGTVTLPEELRGKPLKIVVETELYCKRGEIGRFPCVLCAFLCELCG